MIICFIIALVIHTVQEIKKASQEAYYYSEPCVYVTEYGTKYHSISCQYLAKSSIPIGLYHAIDRHYTACSVCGGKASGTMKYKDPNSSGPSSVNVWSIIGNTLWTFALLGLVIFMLIGFWDRLACNIYHVLHKNDPPQPPANTGQKNAA